MTLNLTDIEKKALAATQYEVNWHSDCVGTDEWSLYANSRRNYFETEQEAKDFIKTLKKVTNPQFQPSIFKRVNKVSVSPDVVLKLIEIVRKQQEALDKTVENSMLPNQKTDDERYCALNINVEIARTALADVTKILEGQR